MKAKLVEDMEVTDDNVLDVLDEVLWLMKSNGLVCFQTKNDLPEAMIKYNRKRKNKLFTIDKDLLVKLVKCLCRIAIYGDDYAYKYYALFKKTKDYDFPVHRRMKFFFLFKTYFVLVAIWKYDVDEECKINTSTEETYYSIHIGNEMQYEMLYPILSLDQVLEKYRLKQEIITEFDLEEVYY